MIRTPIGNFALKPGVASQMVSDADMRRGAVDGQTIRFRWRDFHKSSSRFDLDPILPSVAQCRKVGKPYKLLMQTGRDGLSPTWIGGEWLFWGKQKIPAPWSLDLFNALQIAVSRLAKEFIDDALLVGVHVTGPTWPSAEMHPIPQIQTAKNYSDARMIDAWGDAADLWAAAFPSVGVCLSISVQEPMKRLLDAIVNRAIHAAGDRLCLQHNALKGKTPALAPHHAYIVQAARRGIKTGFEMVCSAVDNPSRFESSNVMDAIAIGTKAGGDYFDIYRPDLKQLRRAA